MKKVIGFDQEFDSILNKLLENKLSNSLLLTGNKGIGIGTELSLNGTVAHAFVHIIYKALLFMSMGAVIAIFIGTLIAIYQDDIKKLLAFSSIAQIGYITLAFSLRDHSGITSGFVHIFNHALIKGGDRKSVV